MELIDNCIEIMPNEQTTLSVITKRTQAELIENSTDEKNKVDMNKEQTKETKKWDEMLKEHFTQKEITEIKQGLETELSDNIMNYNNDDLTKILILEKGFLNKIKNLHNNKSSHKTNITWLDWVSETYPSILLKCCEEYDDINSKISEIEQMLIDNTKHYITIILEKYSLLNNSMNTNTERIKFLNRKNKQTKEEEAADPFLVLKKKNEKEKIKETNGFLRKYLKQCEFEMIKSQVANLIEANSNISFYIENNYYNGNTFVYNNGKIRIEIREYVSVYTEDKYIPNYRIHIGLFDIEQFKANIPDSYWRGHDRENKLREILD